MHFNTKDNAATWEFPYDLGYAGLGIMNSLGFNHSNACWFVRQLEQGNCVFLEQLFMLYQINIRSMHLINQSLTPKLY